MSRRPVGQTAFSLFSFQDIITSVTGIMVLITLILALELVNRIQNAPPAQTSQQAHATQQTIEALRQEIGRLQQQLNASSGVLDSLPSLDLAALTHASDQLDDDALRLRKEIDKAKKQFTKKQQQAIAAQQAEQKNRDAQQQHLQNLNNQVAEAQRKLDDVQNSNRMFFTSGVRGKSIWVVEITSRGFAVAQIGVRAAPQHFSSVSALERWLASLNASQNALYLIVKPRGTSNFDQARTAITELGIDFGFQVMAETQQVLDPQTGAAAP